MMVFALACIIRHKEDKDTFPEPPIETNLLKNNTYQVGLIEQAAGGSLFNLIRNPA